MTSLSIATTAERTGVSAHTLRYYERIGLIDPVGRDENGRRTYRDTDLARIDFLRKLRSTGMPITRMQEYVELIRAGESTEPARLQLLEDHRRRVLHDLEHLNDCLGAINTKIDLYRRSTP
ncbi:MAG TPA: MerR family transcriptional regulator [Acidimicrobiia bacterium]